jgi:uncharacterized protein (TIGR03435 family)
MARGLAILLLGALQALALAQSPAFDTISIRPLPTSPLPSSRMVSLNTGIPSAVYDDGNNTEFKPATISINSRRFYAKAGLVPLVADAYNIPPVFVSGGPGWIDSQLFEIQAKTGAAADESQVKLMLQTLLADRFQLKFHPEVKTRAVYSLTLGKSAAKLTPWTPGDLSVPQILIGQAIVGKKVSMAYLAAYLTRQMGQLVEDHTGLAGDFNFSVDFPKGIVAAVEAEQNDPLMLPWRLGLNVETQKRPVETIVIDHAVRPPRTERLLVSSIAATVS